MAYPEATAGTAGHWCRAVYGLPMPDGLPEVEITEVAEVTVEVVKAFDRLIPQLSRSNPPPTTAELERIVASDASILLVAREPGSDEILGSLTLVVFAIPTAVRAWIEDVVVDESARGRGVGEVLNRAALARARAAGAKTVDLTSRPSREAANRLYTRLGFEPRETNVYRFDLG
jgi:ribosomal protein S18 acetylase RimI-like enzyme